MKPIWQHLKGIGILTLLLGLFILAFHFIDLYGAYLRWVGVVLIIAFIIIVFGIGAVSFYRMLKDIFRKPPSNMAAG
jgi:hypothetical protein